MWAAHLNRCGDQRDVTTHNVYVQFLRSSSTPKPVRTLLTNTRSHEKKSNLAAALAENAEPN